MIVTLTPNPSVDRSVAIATLRRGEVLRATDHHVDAGGKGVNVALALASAGAKARAVVPVGGAEGAQLRALLERAGLDVRFVDITGSVRTNLSVVEPDGTVTKINERGPQLSATEVEALLAATAEAAETADWIVACGSLPPGAPTDLYARVIELGHRVGARVAVDSSGEPFEAALAAGPDLVKPNREELAEAAGGSVDTIGEALDAAAYVLDKGARAVVATLGRAGALYVDAETTYHATTPATEPLNNVGAGDAALAGFLSAPDARPEEALRAAVAWGTAAVRTKGSRVTAPTDLDLDAVQVVGGPTRATRL